MKFELLILKHNINNIYEEYSAFKTIFYFITILVLGNILLYYSTPYLSIGYISKVDNKDDYYKINIPYNSTVSINCVYDNITYNGSFNKTTTLRYINSNETILNCNNKIITIKSEVYQDYFVYNNSIVFIIRLN